MDLRKLRHFVVLAEELNFSRAAEKVHLTQSALSRSIIALEQTLGAHLFDRSNNNVSLTPVGKILLTRAQSLLLDLAACRTFLPDGIMPHRQSRPCHEPLSPD